MWNEGAIGQDDTKQLLLGMVEENRIPHAQLIVGPAGCGKLPVVLSFVQYLYCQNKTKGSACGVCNACKKVNNLVHPDLHFSYPTIGTDALSTQFLPNWRTAVKENPYLNINQWLEQIGAENKQGNITKKECVEIVRKLSLKTFEADYKVLVIWRPEFLGNEGNRLLKIIEEPPEGTLILMIAEEMERILNTIISRCQIVKMNALPDDRIIEALIKRESVQTEVAETAAFLSEGNYNLALQIGASDATISQATLFLEWMRACYQGNGLVIVKWVEQFSRIGREGQKHFIQYALHFMRELVYLLVSENYDPRLPVKDGQSAKKMAKTLDLGKIEAIRVELEHCLMAIGRNANPKVLLTAVSIKVNNVLRSDSN